MTIKTYDYILVQMNFKPRTLDKLEQLKERLHADNRTETVKRALEITDMVIETISKGGRVILEEKDGKQYKLVLPGI